MKIYEWEHEIVAMARTWPASGALFDFMLFVSDFKQTIFIVLPILLFLIFRLGLKKVAVPVGLCLISLAITETISRRVIKALVMRPRPNFLESECLSSPCWGFVSSHATNMFGIAVLLSLYDRRNIYWSLPAALLVSYSRVYLLDHFPMDVIGGAIAGAVAGFLVWWSYETISRLSRPLSPRVSR